MGMALGAITYDDHLHLLNNGEVCVFVVIHLHDFFLCVGFG
jgi:hypothetical protein